MIGGKETRGACEAEERYDVEQAKEKDEAENERLPPRATGSGNFSSCPINTGSR